MTSVLRNVYIEKLDDIVDKYNNTYHSTIKMEPVDVKSSTYIDFIKIMKEIQISKLVIFLEYQNKKHFLKRMRSKLVWRSFFIKKVTDTVLWTYVIDDLNNEEIVWTFYEKELQNTNQRKFRIEKVIKEKGDKFYVKW